MVLDRSDYNVRRLATGGVNPGDPEGTGKLLVGSVIVLSLGLYLWNFAKNRGYPMVDRLAGRASGGRLSATGSTGGDRILG